jgi:DnaJ-class molecular chaperone
VDVYARGVPRERANRDYYATLGLAPDANEDEIRRTYRRLALQWHPDRNPGDPRAEERFKEISEAYAVLIDPAKRGAYDRARLAGQPGGFGTAREDVFRDLFNDPRASAIFEELARELAQAGLHVERRDFERTLFGGRMVVTGGVFVISPMTIWRLGRAVLRAALPRPAPVPALSRGGGLLARAAEVGRRILGLQSPSPDHSPGRDVTFPLRLSAVEAERGGRKRVRLQRTDGDDEVLVTIPAGVRRGTRLRLRGKGRALATGERGDAYLIVEVAGDRV